MQSQTKIRDKVKKCLCFLPLFLSSVPKKTPKEASSHVSRDCKRLWWREDDRTGISTYKIRYTKKDMTLCFVVPEGKRRSYRRQEEATSRGINRKHPTEKQLNHPSSLFFVLSFDFLALLLPDFAFFQRQPSVFIFIFFITSRSESHALHIFSYFFGFLRDKCIFVSVEWETKRSVVEKTNTDSIYLFPKRTQRDRQNGGCFSPPKTDDVAWCVSFYDSQSEEGQWVQ